MPDSRPGGPLESESLSLPSGGGPSLSAPPLVSPLALADFFGGIRINPGGLLPSLSLFPSPGSGGMCGRGTSAGGNVEDPAAGSRWFGGGRSPPHRFLILEIMDFTLPSAGTERLGSVDCSRSSSAYTAFCEMPGVVASNFSIDATAGSGAICGVSELFFNV